MKNAHNVQVRYHVCASHLAFMCPSLSILGNSYNGVLGTLSTSIFIFSAQKIGFSSDEMIRDSRVWDHDFDISLNWRNIGCKTPRPGIGFSEFMYCWKENRRFKSIWRGFEEYAYTPRQKKKTMISMKHGDTEIWMNFSVQDQDIELLKNLLSENSEDVSCKDNNDLFL